MRDDPYIWETFSCVDQQLAYGDLGNPRLQLQVQLRSFAPNEKAARITAGMHFRALLSLQGIDWERSNDPWGDMKDVRGMES